MQAHIFINVDKGIGPRYLFGCFEYFVYFCLLYTLCTFLYLNCSYIYKYPQFINNAAVSN